MCSSNNVFLIIPIHQCGHPPGPISDRFMHILASKRAFECFVQWERCVFRQFWCEADGGRYTTGGQSASYLQCRQSRKALLSLLSLTTSPVINNCAIANWIEINLKQLMTHSCDDNGAPACENKFTCAAHKKWLSSDGLKHLMIFLSFVSFAFQK